MQINVNYYSIYPSRFIAGTEGSHGVEQLDIHFSEEWEGMTKKIVFCPPRCEPVCVIYEDSPIDIPTEVMNARGKTKYAVFGYIDGKRLISVGGEIDVLSTLDDTDNYSNGPTPDEIEQVYAYMRDAFDIAQSVRDDADEGKFDGDSAYEIAVKNGFEGSEQEWLDSLVPEGNGTGGAVNTDDCLKYGDYLLTSNPYCKKKAYISKIDNIFFALNKREEVVVYLYDSKGSRYDMLLTDDSRVDELFNNNYNNASGFLIPAGEKIKVLVRDPSIFVENAYAKFFCSFYNGSTPASVSARVLVQVDTDSTEWYDISSQQYYSDENGEEVWMCTNDEYESVKRLEITITANADKECILSCIECAQKYPTNLSPVVSKFCAERLYYPLSAPEFKGRLTGVASKAISDEFGNNIVSTYATKADILYKEIQITKFINSVNVLEIGSILRSIGFTWELSKEASKLALDGRELDYDISTHTLSGLAITADTTWKLEATDERDYTHTKTTSVKFLNGVYYGAQREDTYDSSFVLLLHKELRQDRKLTFSAEAVEEQYVYYCVPKRFGECSFKVGGFDGGFSLVATIPFTNSSGYTEDYYIYRSDNAALGAVSVSVS